LPGFLILAVLAGSAVFLLWIPVDLVVCFATDRRPRFRAEVQWWFGLVKKDLKGRKRRREEEADRRQGAGWIESRGRLIFRLIRVKGFVRQVVRLMRESIRHMRIRELHVICRVGLGDPADTGFLFSLVGPFVFLLGRSLSYELRVEPVFGTEPVFETDSLVNIRVRPISLVPSVARFTFSRSTLKALWPLFSERWKSKKK
jgi:hypothetical protein